MAQGNGHLLAVTSVDQQHQDSIWTDVTTLQNRAGGPPQTQVNVSRSLHMCGSKWESYGNFLIVVGSWA